MKVSDTYESLVQGVSEQFAEDRRDGQHTENINMLNDPVIGLARRQGSIFQAEATITGSVLANMQADVATWRHMAYTSQGKEYVVMYRTAAAASDMVGVVVYNKTDKKFIPVVRPVVDATLDAFFSGGCTAMTSVGKFVFAAGAAVVPAATTTALWGEAANKQRTACWIRGGAYNREYTVTCTKTDGTVVTTSYTTPKAAYQEILDTSKVPQFTADPAGGTQSYSESAYVVLNKTTTYYEHALNWGDWNPSAITCKRGANAMTNTYPAVPVTDMQFSYTPGAKTVRFSSLAMGLQDVSITYTALKTVTNPNYTAVVAQMTSAYSRAVTEWISSAADAIQPNAIANQLAAGLYAQGVNCMVEDGTIKMENVTAISVKDDGDSTLIRGVANEVTSADQVSKKHWVGKTVRVKATGSDSVYYLTAKATASGGTAGWQDVVWSEGAGVKYTINTALIVGYSNGDTFYIAGSPAALATLSGITVPGYEPSVVGDGDTSPLPYFIGKKITYLDVFQDRLIVGCGGVIRASKVGDYLNFFRSSVLTAPQDDTVETLSQGSEDDELRHGVLYERNLVVFGKRRQYIISGSTTFSPTSPNMAVMSSHEGAGDLPPIPAGGIIFYGKQGQSGVSCSVHEIRPGVNAESPDSFPTSSQLSSYMVGTAVELVKNAKPSMLFLRTSGAPNTLYTFTYLDMDSGRKQDAWSKWKFNSELGNIISVSPTPDGLLVFFLRSSNGSTWVVCDLCPVEAALSQYPYLDSHRPWSKVVAGASVTPTSTSNQLITAFDMSTEYKMLGGLLSDRAALLLENPGGVGTDRTGYLQEAKFIPTNPRVRDKNDKVITTGRLTVTSLGISYRDSSGFIVEVNHVGSGAGRAGTVLSFNGLVFGQATSLVGRIPVGKGTLSVGVGIEAKQYEVVIKAREWKPLTITTITYVGQFFNRVQRI